ncbi:hypothetical protein PENANT_c006G00013 [Penicillium antarcticum]|uniref:Uncharacterized protein n=1 Tax=Penicillium antarcticum TaxID=416450 RepID=A0A1V6QCW6_9EURO|nr:hypothetical protein PENANT_c006G00013 [Penicillium antarcticum]
MAEEAAWFKLNKARALIRETELWARRDGRRTLSTELCRLNCRIGGAMDKSHLYPPEKPAPRKTQVRGRPANCAPQPWQKPFPSQSDGKSVRLRTSSGSNAPLPAKKNVPGVPPVPRHLAAPTAPKTMHRPVASKPSPRESTGLDNVNPPVIIKLSPQEYMIDLTEDVAVVSTGLTVLDNLPLKEKDESPVYISDVNIPSPVEPESEEALISFESDSDTHSKVTSKRKKALAAASKLSPTAPVFKPSEAIPGNLISFDDDVEIASVNVAPETASSDQDIIQDPQWEDMVVEVDLTTVTGLTSFRVNESRDESEDSELTDEEVAVIPQSVNTPDVPSDMEADSTVSPVDVEPSAVRPSRLSDIANPDCLEHPHMADGGSAILEPVDESSLEVNPNVGLGLIKLASNRFL